MRMTLHRLSLPLAHEFTISRASIATQPTLIVELEDNGLHGYGEVTENPYYGHTFASMTASLDKVSDRLDDYLTESPSALWARMNRLIGGDTFALSALDMAAHDLRGRRQNIPTWQDWRLNWGTVPMSSYTIGLDSIEKMVAKTERKT